jgi:phosphohistidine phosphatase SixA
MVMRKISLLSVFLVALTITGPARADASNLWGLLKTGEHFAMIRHALAPGNGDPEGFTLGDCSTQRNLDDVGRSQAARIGDLFRAGGVREAQVYSSQWCRCLETAAGMKLGPVNELPALNSFYQLPQNKAPQMKALRAWLADRPLDRPTVLVTHYTVIAALTDAYPGSGEIIFVRRDGNGGFSVVGTLPTN